MTRFRSAKRGSRTLGATTDRAEGVQSFEEVFLGNYARVVGILRRVVGDYGRAEELASEVFLKLYRQKLVVNGGGSVTGWLYRTATNVGIDALRAANRRSRLEQAAAQRRTWRRIQLKMHFSKWRGRKSSSGCVGVLADLKPAQAQLLLLRAAGHSYKELAAALEIEAGSVGTSLVRAEAAFAERYRELYGDRGGCMNCVSENILRAYQDGELDAAGRAEVERHVAGCDACAQKLREMAGTAAMVSGRLSALDAGAADGSVDAKVALASFKARHDSGVEKPARVTRMFDRRWRPAWVTAMAATIIFAALAFPSGRSMAQRFLATLRIEKVQPITVDFSALDGNRPLGEMLSKMLSDKVVVTADEKVQHVDSAKAASQLAGFPVQLIRARTDDAGIYRAGATCISPDGGPRAFAGRGGPGGAAGFTGAGDN